MSQSHDPELIVLEMRAEPEGHELRAWIMDLIGGVPGDPALPQVATRGRGRSGARDRDERWQLSYAT
jgi:hypothetical protein